jgi:membrane-bound lytic murein transglycosylase D
MKHPFYILFAILLGTSSLFAQIENDSIKPVVPKISVLDSLKNTFVKHNEASRIDNLWMQELANSELSGLMHDDILNINPDENVEYDLPTAVLKERLAKLDAKSPFHIDYNIGLENVIKSLLKNRKKSYERLLGISQYYFPLFEEALSKYNIPIEVKYLAIVESALNPRAKSRVGATGLWQFMYNTGLQYKLDVNSYIDDRSDPIKATEAACQYLSGMYKIFGDWDLVLASYNCGPGNVTKAINRSGGQTNYWNIRKKLPRETAGYLPAFLATMYIMEFHKEHGINKPKPLVNYFKTDTLSVKKQLTFRQLSQLLDMPETELQFLNPMYKLDVVPFLENKKNFIRLPQDKVAIFTSNEDKIYFYADYEANLREKPKADPIVVKDTLNYFTTEQKLVTRFKSYKVKKGDDLSEIASKYGVTIADIKHWNRLKSDKAPKGKVLKIETTESVAVKVKHAIKKENPIVDVKIDTIQPKKAESLGALESINTKAEEKVVVANPIKETTKFRTEKTIVNKEVTKNYKVKKGDNLSSIANDLNVEVAELKKWNHLKGNSVKKGANLKYTTTQKVEVAVKKKVADKPEFIATIESTKTENNSVNNDQKKTFYVVSKGDNIWKIAGKFNTTGAHLRELNNLTTNDLKNGMKLIVSDSDAIENNSSKQNSAIKEQIKAKEKVYLVQKGDTLFTEI